MKTRIVRGKVHCIANKIGSVYQMMESGHMAVTLCQEEFYIENNKAITDRKEVLWETDYMDLRINSCVPGNIHEYITTEPPDLSDELYALYWEGDKVKRDSYGRALYRLFRYEPCELYQMYGDLATGGSIYH